MNRADLAYLLFLAEIPTEDTQYQSHAPDIWAGDPVLRGMYETKARQVTRLAADRPAPTTEVAHHA